MPNFSYATKDKNLKKFEAKDAQDALAVSAGFADRDPTSGVINEDLGGFEDTTDDKGFDFKGTGIGDVSISSEEDDLLEQLIKDSRKSATSDVNEKDIRRKNLELFQGQIDSVNLIYDSLVAGEKIQGEDRSGQGRAIANRQGLIGSQRGETQRQNIVARNSDIMQSIQAERAYKINQILGQAQSQSLAEIKEAKAAKEQGATSYLKYLGVQDERREKNVKAALSSLISQGFTLDDLSKDDMGELTKNLRVSSDELRTTYESLLPETVEDEAFTLGANDIRFDSKGNVIARGSKTGGGASSSSSSSSSSPSSSSNNEEVEILTFEEFKATPEAQALLKEAEDAAKQNFIPERQDEILRQVYDQQVAELEASTKRTANDGSTSSTPSLQNLTATKKGELEQAGLSTASGNAQTYYLNTPTGFKQYYAREVAAGRLPANGAFEQVDSAYEQWYAKEEGGSSSGGAGSDPFDF